jgi:hypothetical protein
MSEPNNLPPWEGFPKIQRLKRTVIATEKIDGTNAQIYITDDGAEIFAGSRNRWITPENDNFGFARWVQENREELLKLGPGRHFGEWWGSGIQRNYGLKEKRFSLFNSGRWSNPEQRPACCHVVPVLAIREDFGDALEHAKAVLVNGSVAAPGFMKPEGVVLFHPRSGAIYKWTFEGDSEKGA